MSVYKPAKTRFWQYDFVIEGRRFHGSTGQVTRRGAETFERKKRLEAASGQFGAVASMTLDIAAGRWWAEKGIHRGDAVDVEDRIGIVLRLLGEATRLGDIDQAAVAAAIETRRQETYVKARDRHGRPVKGAKHFPLSNATVNRDIIETLRPILRRARTHWTKRATPHGLADIDWRELRLPEPRGQSRLYTQAERTAWRAACADDVALALDLILTYGLRFGELFFPLDAFKPDPMEPELVLQKGRKRDVLLHLPIRQDHGREIAARVARARAANADQNRPETAAPLEHIWFRQDGDILVAYSRSQIEYRLSKAADAAGVTGGRRIHGGRHHAGSTILKKTTNLKAVQGLLGHATIASSQRYAHVLTSDLRAALEDDLPRNSPEPAGGDEKQSLTG